MTIGVTSEYEPNLKPARMAKSSELLYLLQMHTLKIIDVDGEPAIVFPDEMIAALKLKAGSTLLAIPDAQGFKLVVDEAAPGTSSAGK